MKKTLVNTNGSTGDIPSAFIDKELSLSAHHFCEDGRWCDSTSDGIM